MKQNFLMESNLVQLKIFDLKVIEKLVNHEIFKFFFQCLDHGSSWMHWEHLRIHRKTFHHNHEQSPLFVHQKFGNF